MNDARFSVISHSKNGRVQVVEKWPTGGKKKNGEPEMMSRTHHLEVVQANIAKNKNGSLYVDIKTGCRVKKMERKEFDE